MSAALATALVACGDPVGPAHEIAGEYELAARVQDDSEVPVDRAGDGALLVLRSDRTWVLRRHDGDRPLRLDGFGLTDRYRFEVGAPDFALTMFTEGPFMQILGESATVHGDTLRWGREVFIRR